MTSEEIDNFLAKVDKTDSCWLWIGMIDSYGYGRFYSKGQIWMPHRWSYTFEYGSIPDGLQIDHLCRVRNCVNPDHLEAVTGHENRRRRLVLITHCPHGHEYTEENTYINKRNGRICRTCMAKRSKKSQQKKQLRDRELREERKQKGLRYNMQTEEWS